MNDTCLLVSLVHFPLNLVKKKDLFLPIASKIPNSLSQILILAKNYIISLWGYLSAVKLETQYLLKSFSSRMLSTHSTSRKTKFRTSSSKRLVLRWAHFFYMYTINFHFNSSEYHQLLPSSKPNWLTNLQNQNKVTGNKKGKKGEFEDAAKYMLTVHRNDLFYFCRLLHIGYNM